MAPSIQNPLQYHSQLPKILTREWSKRILYFQDILHGIPSTITWMRSFLLLTCSEIGKDGREEGTTNGSCRNKHSLLVNVASVARPQNWRLTPPTWAQCLWARNEFVLNRRTPICQVLIDLTITSWLAQRGKTRCRITSFNFLLIWTKFNPTLS